MLRRSPSRRLPFVLLSSLFAVVGMFVSLGLLLRYRALSSPGTRYLGRIEAPGGQVLRFATGAELESLDPQLGSSQTDKQVYTALFEGLVEYGLRNSGPIPAIAERWVTNEDSTEFVFYLRKNARWSDGELITAEDFVYTIRRGLAPEFASPSAYLANYIKYAQPYSEGGVFVRDPRTRVYLLERDFPAPASNSALNLVPEPVPAPAAPPKAGARGVGPPDPAVTSFHQFINSPTRLSLPGDVKARDKLVEQSPRLKAVLVGKEFVPVRAEDVGVEAVDDYTIRITLHFPAPYMISLLADPFFRILPRRAIERYGGSWTDEGKIVTSGPFTLLSRERDSVTVVRNQLYWDTGNVKLDEVVFSISTGEGDNLLNLYITGEVDAINAQGPFPLLHVIKGTGDYMEAPQLYSEYYGINVTKPPMNDRRVREAFNLALDRKAIADLRLTRPLYSVTPDAIFPGYDAPKVGDLDLVRAKSLLAEAGFKGADGKYDPTKFPADAVEITYPTSESNFQVAELVQMQWRQNLGITVPLHNTQFGMFLSDRSQLRYKGFTRGGWIGDYADPCTFLDQFRRGGEASVYTGWSNPAFDSMLDAANRTPDAVKRYELLAYAEAYLLNQYPVIPLLNPSGRWLRKPYVQGMSANTELIYPWKFIYIEPDPDRWDEGNP